MVSLPFDFDIYVKTKAFIEMFLQGGKRRETLAADILSLILFPNYSLTGQISMKITKCCKYGLARLRIVALKKGGFILLNMSLWKKILYRVSFFPLPFFLQFFMLSKQFLCVYTCLVVINSMGYKLFLFIAY